MENTEVVTGEIVSPDTGLVRAQSVTIEQLANDVDGLEKTERGIAIMKVLRAASIAVTFPHDWVLFKAEDRITGFLQEVGCQRIRDIWGIEITDLQEFVRTEDAETKDFSYAITGNGYSKRTGQMVYDLTGTRYSYEDFIVHRKLKALQIETEVKKAARANLDGNIVRALAGMKSVPAEELDEVWIKAGMTSYKSTKLCPKGRGFGTANERAGGSSEKNGGVDVQDIPFCTYCEPPERLVFRAEKQFWGCRNYGKHPDQKMIIQHKDLLKQIEDRKKAASGA